MSSLRDRRMDAEWLSLQQLAQANPSILCDVRREDDAFCVRFGDTPAWLRDSDGAVVAREHTVLYKFPRFFPTLPPEAFCERILLHPNIHPQSGFVCLWASYTPKLSILNAVVVTRLVFAHHAVNREAHHCMQPAGLDRAPLPLPPLHIPESLAVVHSVGVSPRRRLSLVAS